MKKVLCINTGGVGDLHELRARRLTANLKAHVTHYNVDRSLSRQAASRLTQEMIKSEKWSLIYQESTGIASGINLIRAAISHKQAFIVSSGDPISGFFHVTKGPLFGSIFGIYEKLLYRTCTGFVGWTPYLTGRAMQMGAKRAVTVEGAVDLSVFEPYSLAEKLKTKQEFGLNPQHLVCGVVGSLKWTPRQSYCYGLELVESLKRITRQDVSVLIVGDGDGRGRLESLVPENLRSRVIFTGRLPEDKVAHAVNAMDIGFITQTLDALGNYRLTTKLPEYLACSVPVAMSPVPGFFDYVTPAGWPLPAFHPASREFHLRCAQWLDQLDWSEVQTKSGLARQIACKHFDYAVVSARFCDFVEDILRYSEKQFTL